MNNLVRLEEQNSDLPALLIVVFEDSFTDIISTSLISSSDDGHHEL